MSSPTTLEEVCNEFGGAEPRSAGLYEELAPVYAFTMAQRDMSDAYFDFVTSAVPEDADSVAEFACGDGSLLARLDREYEQTVGIDRSAPLLAIARSKTDAPLVRADVRQCRLDASFDAVAMVGRSLAHMLTDEDVRRCFDTAARTLIAGGRFVFDCHDRSALSGEYSREREFEDDRYRVRQETETTVRERETGVVERVDRFVIEAKKTAASATVETDPWRYRAFDRSVLERLLDETGFTVRSVDSEYGGHQVVAER